MKRILFLLLTCCITFSAIAQKTAYIPAYLLDTTTVDGAQFTWSKTAQSPNFTIIWGNTVGTDPAAYTADTTIAFDPSVILDTMEYLYARFKTMGFLDDSVGTNLAIYKIPIVMYNTWGPLGATGYANGGDADGIIGAFWVHPIAMHGGHVAAHEFTHSLQSQCQIDFRTTYGFGPEWLNAGIFWETHANFMRNQVYLQDISAWGMDDYHNEIWGSWKNTYENYEFLIGIQQAYGMDMVTRLWRESLPDEYPMQAFQRLAGLSQSAFNDVMFDAYARHMATFDFTVNNFGTQFRMYRDQDLTYDLTSIQSTYNILQQVPGSTDRYAVPIEQAPEEYGYNVIPLYLNPDSCSVIVRFKGHTEANTHTGWRYGFVTEHPDGTLSRYSNTYYQNTKEISFSLEGDETKMYLVVMGAPNDLITTDTSNDTWHGYPKHFRFPYEVAITGAVPEGYQPAANFRAQLKTDGHLHPNGGGWVDNAATVAATAYVGPYAMVLGSATVSGAARVDNTAIVKDATITDNAQVLDNAVVFTGSYGVNTVVRGNSYAENNVTSGNALIDMRARVSNYHLSGSIEVGGDVIVYNDTGNCDNGVYYRLTNYYDNKVLECDGRTATYITNLDVNSIYTAFSDAQMAVNCHCATLPGCLTLGVGNTTPSPFSIQVAPNPATHLVTFSALGQPGAGTLSVRIFNATGIMVSVTSAQESFCDIDVTSLPLGIYIAQVSINAGAPEHIKLIVAH